MKFAINVNYVMDGRYYYEKEFKDIFEAMDFVKAEAHDRIYYVEIRLIEEGK